MEHNHYEQPTERLESRLQELLEINKPWQGSAERVAQIRSEMAIIGFELACRYAKEHDKEWSDE